MACALAACGSDAVALDPVAEAATKTSAAESMRIEMSDDNGVARVRRQARHVQD